MARRRPGGQPGNHNARGHRGANAFSYGKAVGSKVKAEGKRRAISGAYRAAAQGVTVSRVVKGVEVRANVSFRPAPRRPATPSVNPVTLPSVRGTKQRQAKRERRARRG